MSVDVPLASASIKAQGFDVGPQIEAKTTGGEARGSVGPEGTEGGSFGEGQCGRFIRRGAKRGALRAVH